MAKHSAPHGLVSVADGDAGHRPARQRPHLGAQFRFTDIGGRRFSYLATDTNGGQLADLDLRHHRLWLDERTA